MYILGIPKLNNKEEKAMNTTLSNYTTEQLQKELDKRNLEKYSDFEIQEEIKRRNKIREATLNTIMNSIRSI